MRGRVAVVLALVGAALAAIVGDGEDALADAAGQQRPQFADAWGTSGIGDAELENPRGVAVNRTTGDIYVADTANDRIVRYDADGRLLGTFGSTAVNGLPLDSPWDVAVNGNGWIYVADTGNDRIVRYTNAAGAGAGLTWGSAGSGNLRFNDPKGIDVGTDGDVWVADTGNDKIKVYEFDGTFQRKFGTSGSGNGQFDDPRDVAIGIEGRAYVADTGNDRIQVFDSVGGFITAFGRTGTGSRRFESPQGVWIGNNLPPSGSVFVADTGNDRVTVWDLVGNTPTFERKFGGTGSGNRQMEAPRNVFMGQDGRRFVVDTGNDRLQVFDPPITEGISGQVVDATSGVGLGEAVVSISDATTFDLVAVVQADADGDYQAAVPPGEYAVAFFDPAGAYDFEYYEDQPDFSTFEPVLVNAGSVTTGDMEVSAPLPTAVANPGNIAGTVTESAGPAAGTWVLAIDATGHIDRAVQVDPAGDYEIVALEQGNYTLLFLDPRGVNPSEFHDDTPDPTAATPVVVQLGQTTDVDAVLGP